LVTQPQRTQCGICKYCVAIVVEVLHINKLHSVANSSPRVEISLGLVYRHAPGINTGMKDMTWGNTNLVRIPAC
jgi:hypothetical protein